MKCKLKKVIVPFKTQLNALERLHKPSQKIKIFWWIMCGQLYKFFLAGAWVGEMEL